jgi:uncharacterized protein
MTSCEESERNRAVITAAFEAWRDDGAWVTDCFAPEMTWRIEGHSAASRAYANKREFIDEVLAPFGRRLSTSDPFRPVSIEDQQSPAGDRPAASSPLGNPVADCRSG